MAGFRNWVLATGVLALAAGASTAMAHHSFAVFFDPEKEVTLEGTVTAFRFTNPHGTIVLDVEGPDGRVQKWRVETNAPVVLRRRGWTRASIRPGDEVRIEGWRARDGKRYVRLRRATDLEGNLIGNTAFGQNDD